MGASTPQVSRRVHWRACQFGIVLERCGTRHAGLGMMENGGRARGAGPFSFRLCQAAASLSISLLPHVVEDFRWSASVQIAKFAYICGKLGANFRDLKDTSQANEASVIQIAKSARPPAQRDDADFSIITLARYFIARLPNWRQISGASLLGPCVATIVSTSVPRRREHRLHLNLGRRT